VSGHDGSVHQQPWPGWDPQLAREQVVQIAVQVDGRLREVIELPLEINEEEVKLTAMSLDRIQPFLTGLEVVRTIYVPGKVFNILTRK
jgi:leucyl-tRNA synthetase